MSRRPAPRRGVPGRPPRERNPLVRWISQLLNKQRRASEREPRFIDVYLFTNSGLAGRVNMLDESEDGVRLSCPDAQAMISAKYILNPHNGVAHKIERVWRSGREAGFRYVGELRMRGYADDDGVEALREFWRSYALKYNTP